MEKKTLKCVIFHVVHVDLGAAQNHWHFQTCVKVDTSKTKEAEAFFLLILKWISEV